ncbi:hypothetical protein N8506_03305 [Synechococcus sp. AH-601-N23]|nr:hypothetical protein [Synechococcus sp. AH-601-N23]
MPTDNRNPSPHQRHRSQHELDATGLLAIIHSATHQNLSQPKKPDKTRHHPNQIHPEEHARADELDL